VGRFLSIALDLGFQARHLLLDLAAAILHLLKSKGIDTFRFHRRRGIRANSGTIIVPGHGDDVDPHFISWQGTGLDAIHGQCEWLVSQAVSEADAYAYPGLQWPWDEQWVKGAIHQAYAELAAAGIKPVVRSLPIQAIPRG